MSLLVWGVSRSRVEARWTFPPPGPARWRERASAIPFSRKAHLESSHLPHRAEGAARNVGARCTKGAGAVRGPTARVRASWDPPHGNANGIIAFGQRHVLPMRRARGGRINIIPPTQLLLRPTACPTPGRPSGALDEQQPSGAHRVCNAVGLVAPCSSQWDGGTASFPRSQPRPVSAWANPSCQIVTADLQAVLKSRRSKCIVKALWRAGWPRPAPPVALHWPTAQHNVCALN